MAYKYKAFISYRHLEPDMQAAEKLQKLLEAYRPPKNLGKTKENWRIFRDVSELQSSSDLSEDIVNAIENSEFLIVICSPKYTESKWCMQELTRFRELHDNTNKNIITLLVSGEPHEAFPEELTYTEMTTTDDKGEEVKVKVEVEPLAANIKADSLKESMKKLDTEYLRIAAPLLECDFNDLYQRERRREAARRRRIFAVVSGVLSLITVISVASAVTINGKNVEINKQNTQIKEQNEQIEQKNKDLLVENAGHLASESENLFKENNLVKAVKKAVEALPSDGEDKPVIPEAEYALSRELGVFNNEQVMPKLALKHECTVEKLSFMGEGKAIVSQDATGLYFWNPESGELIKKISVSDGEFVSATNSSSNEFTVHFDASADTTGTKYTFTGPPSSTIGETSSVYNMIYTGFSHDITDEEPGFGGDVYLCNSDNTVWRLDGATGEVKWKADASENVYEYNKTVFDEKYIIRIYRKKTVMPSGLEMAGRDSYAELIDRETGNIIDTVKVAGTSGDSFSFVFSDTILGIRDGVMYIFSDDDGKISAYDIKDHSLSLKNEIVADTSDWGISKARMQFIKEEPVTAVCSIKALQNDTIFTRYDKDMKTQKWQTSLPENYSEDGKMCLMPAADTGYTHDVLAVSTNLSLSFIDYETGSVIKSLKFDNEVASMLFSRRGFAMIIFESGEEYLISLSNYTSGNAASEAIYRVQDINTSVLLCSYSRGKYVTSADYSNTAYIRYSEQNPAFRDINTGEYMYSKDVLAADETGTYAAVVSKYYPEGKYSSGTETVNHLFVYCTSDNGTLTEVKDLEEYKIIGAAFAGTEKLVVSALEKDSSAYKDEFYIIDVKTGKAEKIPDAIPSDSSEAKLIPSGNGVFYLSDIKRNITFITADGKASSWEKNAEGTAYERKIAGGMYAVNDTRAALLVEEGEDSEKSIVVYSFDSEKSVKLDCDLSSDEGLSVQRIFWHNSSTVGVFFSNRTVTFFDAKTGKADVTVSLVGTSQEPVSVVPVTDDKFAVLCRDSHIYEMDKEGFTGRSCRLEFADDTQNDIREYDSEDAGMFEVMPGPDEFRKYVVWDDDEAWLLDTDHFSVRYRIDDFAAAGGNSVFITDAIYNKAGVFPVYSTEQLLETAENFLSALGKGMKGQGNEE